MKKFLTFFTTSLIILSLFSCASTSVFPGDEEYLEPKKINYKPENKTFLTQKELREDCDMLKYCIYTTYAGIDEAIDNGFDLDGTIEEIYNETLKKKIVSSGLYSSSDFSSIIRKTMSKNLNNTDQHISVCGNLKESYCVRYSNIYLSKEDSEYFVSKSDSDEIHVGDKYTGPEKNLYKFITKDGDIYRYGVFTNKNLKSAVISINNQQINVKAEAEKIIPSKSAWTGIQTTEKTLYMSLGDCDQGYGVTDASENLTYVWDNFLTKISEQAKGKENIIFDLRSNPGGYLQYPAKMLVAAYYNEHSEDKDFVKNMNSLFWNTATEGCTLLSSPIIMSIYKDMMKNYWKNEYESLNEDTKTYFKAYWSSVNFKPLRKHIPLNYKTTTFESFPEPDFKGNVYVLINSSSASAAEFGTQMTYFLEDQGIKVTLVGENSWGGIKYGGMFNFYLPHSGLYGRVGDYFGESPTLLSIPAWKGEGYGYFPDYWATNDVILDTLVQLTGDSQLTESLNGLDKGQL